MAGKRKRLYVRVLHLVTPEQKAKIKELAGKFNRPENEIVRRALDFGLSILEKLGIDNRASDDTMDAGQADDSEGNN